MRSKDIKVSQPGELHVYGYGISPVGPKTFLPDRFSFHSRPLVKALALKVEPGKLVALVQDQILSAWPVKEEPASPEEAFESYGLEDFEKRRHHLENHPTEETSDEDKAAWHDTVRALPAPAKGWSLREVTPSYFRMTWDEFLGRRLEAQEERKRTVQEAEERKADAEARSKKVLPIIEAFGDEHHAELNLDKTSFDWARFTYLTSSTTGSVGHVELPLELVERFLNEFAGYDL
jgi:hypothetical protein